jgi:non-heme chloroperoxidase
MGAIDTKIEGFVARLSHRSRAAGPMSTGTIVTKDGTDLFYKDWGKGQPVVFSHGWPLNADAWDEQLVFFASKGYRTIAHDRRGHGRSSQPWNGNDMDTYADDLATLMDTLDVRDAILVGHSTGGGEVARYIGRHGTRRVAKAALIDAVTPSLLKTETNPAGLPREAFDGFRAAVASGRTQFYKDFAVQFYGANRPGSKVPQGLLDQVWSYGMQIGLKAAYDCIHTWELDYTEDLQRLDVPTLVGHGDDDQIVPVAMGKRTAEIVKKATLKLYPGGPHGVPGIRGGQFNADLLAFIKGAPS